MNEIIYLEPDDDITGVISRIKETDAKLVGLVIPRGGTLAQSIINLKILKREVEGAGKEISLVTNDKISKNLASQVGITVYGSANEAKSARPVSSTPDLASNAEESSVATVPNQGEQVGIKVNRYHKEEGVESEKDIESVEKTGEGSKEVGKAEKVEKNVEKKVERKSIVREPERNIEKPIPHKASRDKKPKKIGSKKKALLIIGSIVLAAALVLAYIFVPSATATIILTTTDLETTNEIVVDKNVKNADSVEFIIPGDEVEVKKDLVKEFTASGVKDVGEKATAEITFYNNKSTDPQIITAGTVVTASGQSFTLDETISIPGQNLVSNPPLVTTPGSTTGKITATNPGAEYNIESANFVISSFTGLKRDKIYGQSSSAISGGTSKKVTVISEDDMNNAKASMQVELEEAAKVSILEEAGEDSKLISSTFRSAEESFNASKNVDEETATFTLTKKIKTTAMTFSEVKLREMVIAKNETDLGEGKALINSDEALITYDVVSFDEESGKVTLAVKFVGKVGNKIEEDVIKDQITNKKFGEAVSTIKAIEGVEDLELDIWPTILARTPFIKQRITIEFGYSQ